MALTVTYICNNSSTLYSGDFFVFQCMLPTWLKMCARKYHVSGCFKHSTLCLVRSYSYWNILSLTCLSALMCNVFSFKESDSWKPLAYNYFYMVRRQTYEIMMMKWASDSSAIAQNPFWFYLLRYILQNKTTKVAYVVHSKWYVFAFFLH